MGGKVHEYERSKRSLASSPSQGSGFIEINPVMQIHSRWQMACQDTMREMLLLSLVDTKLSVCVFFGRGHM